MNLLNVQPRSHSIGFISSNVMDKVWIIYEKKTDKKHTDVNGRILYRNKLSAFVNRWSILKPPSGKYKSKKTKPLAEERKRWIEHIECMQRNNIAMFYIHLFLFSTSCLSFFTASIEWFIGFFPNHPAVGNSKW